MERQAILESENFWSNPTTSVIKEYRIVLPLTVDEYQIGQAYGIVEGIKEMKDIHGGMKWLVDEEVKTENGIAQYTETKYPLIPDKDRTKWCSRWLTSKRGADVTEKSYDAYPVCRTSYANDYMNENFHLIVDSRHEEGVPKIENIFALSPTELAKREVINIDIVNDQVKSDKHCDSPDPSQFQSKTGRGLYKGPFWPASEKKVMCIYKLYRLEFKWKVVQRSVERGIYDTIQKGLFHFNRQVVCSMDQWLELDLSKVREYEIKTRKECQKEGTLQS